MFEWEREPGHDERLCGAEGLSAAEILDVTRD